MNKVTAIAMFALIVSLVWLALIGYALGKNPISSDFNQSRQGRFFPFYTIGRFPNDLCTGSNQMLGTCVVRGECKDGGGVSTGGCSSVTNQAVCCVCKRASRKEMQQTWCYSVRNIHIDQLSCGATTSLNNTYFYNSGYPGTFPGGPRCTLVIEPCSEDICQVRIDFLAFSLAPPNGNGECLTDFITIAGGSSRVPRICGENAGQHVYVDFNGESPIVISVDTTPGFTFNRQWQLLVRHISCGSPYKAPSGCLQYHLGNSGTVMSFNYGASPNALPNSFGVDGTRQLANLRYGICIRMGANKCSITWSQTASDMYSFTVTGDVGAIDPSLLGTDIVQSQDCTTDFVIIPNPSQGGIEMPSDRFCGLGLVETTSMTKPFVLFVVQDGDENTDIANRGFSIGYSQVTCPVV